MSPSPLLAVVGVMTALPDSRDVQIDQVTVLFHGHEILQDAKLEFNYGRRYGLLGPNGCGKTTLLTALGNRELPIQDHIDTYFMAGEIPASGETPAPWPPPSAPALLRRLLLSGDHSRVDNRSLQARGFPNRGTSRCEE